MMSQGFLRTIDFKIFYFVLHQYLLLLEVIQISESISNLVTKRNFKHWKRAFRTLSNIFF